MRWMENLNQEGRDLFADCCCRWVADLSQAYYHIEIDKRYWKYLCFRWNGKVYCFTVLPFGISSAPHIFTLIVKVMLWHWQEEFGVLIMGFINDMIGGTVTPELA
eukprot:3911655-Rhodomonas_salina.1